MTGPSDVDVARQVAAMRTELAQVRRLVEQLLARTPTPPDDPTVAPAPRVLDHSTPDDFEELPDGTVRPLRARSTT